MPEIKIDVDREIKVSKNSLFEYQANAKTLSAYFNKVDGDLGIWVCYNPDREYWSDVAARDNTWVFFDLPEGAKVFTNANIIIYDYGDVSIKFDILLDKIRRTIILNTPSAIPIIDKFLSYKVDLGLTTSATYISDKQLDLFANDKKEISVKTYRAYDSAKIPFMEPCYNCDTEKLCGQVEKGIIKCAGDHARCTRKKELQYKPSESLSEILTVTDGRLELSVDSKWLSDSDRVFPLFINDDITGNISSVTGYGFFSANASNVFDGNTGTYGGASCISAPDEATEYIDIALDDTYNIDSFSVHFRQTCTSSTLTAELLYDDSGYTSFSPVCVVTNVNNAASGSWEASNDVSGQSQTASNLRITFDANSGARLNVNEIEIFGSATGGGGGRPLPQRVLTGCFGGCLNGVF